MEINIEQTDVRNIFIKAFTSSNVIKFKFTSTDIQDLDKQFIITKDQITSIEEDVEGLSVWWKKWSQLEGKYVTMSNYFREYEFI